MSDAIAELAPTGVLRVAINTGNAATVTVLANGELDGPAPACARQIAKNIDRPLEFIRFPSAHAIFLSVGTGSWDIAFLAEDPARAGKLAFSPPYLVIEATYAVAFDAPFVTVASVDSPGRRIASSEGAAYDLHLQRTLEFAARVPFESPRASLIAFTAGGFDAVAGVRATLDRFVESNTGYRVLADAFLKIGQAVATEASRVRAAALLHNLVDDSRTLS